LILRLKVKMSYSSSLLTEAVDALSKLPGIGRKSALRLVLHLIRKDKEVVTQDLLSPLQNIIQRIKFCKTCHHLSDEDKCNICTTRTHKSDQICVVESVRDVMAIEETGQYHGLYHVLGGVISPLDGISPDQLFIDDLIVRATSPDIKEVIMAISPTMEGETTIYYLSRKLESTSVQITMLARGISFGGELEYADEVTLGRSIATRLPYTTSTL